MNDVSQILLTIFAIFACMAAGALLLLTYIAKKTKKRVKQIFRPRTTKYNRIR